MHKKISLNKVALVLFVLGIISNLGNLFLSHIAFRKAEQAYREINCPSTILYSDRVIKTWRIVDLNDYTNVAQNYKKQCLQFQAALDLEVDGKMSEAIVAYNNFLIRYGFRAGNPLVEAAQQRIKTIFQFSTPKALEQQKLCDNFNLLEDSDLIPEGFNWASLYLDCARMLAEQKSPKANFIYEKFVAAHPNHPLVPQAKAEWAQSMIVTNKGQEAGKLPPLGEFGRAKDGTTTLMITNESPLPIRIFLDGPESRVEELERCPSCRKYSLRPSSCSGQGTTGTYKINPGQYDVLVRFLDGERVVPYEGNWEFKANTIHGHCFFIVLGFQKD